MLNDSEVWKKVFKRVVCGTEFENNQQKTHL